MAHPRHGLIDILVRDVSERGMGGKCEAPLMVGESVTLHLPDSPAVQGKIAWAKGQSFGVELEGEIDPEAVKSRAERSSESSYQVPPQYQPSKDSRRPGFRTLQKTVSKWPPPS
ncbi:PilZ domain-containing protein [Sphingobium bisphenolivorans]|uniref:PilZ domain-containing protein n=1 Tax=Sphingobium bisphenolivorans TaxID=1335760 RepID=UPI00039F69A4|nr:PilZ domain-containing protein [Sphingobium bisphenolivorans]